jgi:hypothetical protein
MYTPPPSHGCCFTGPSQKKAKGEKTKMKRQKIKGKLKFKGENKCKNGN